MGSLGDSYSRDSMHGSPRVAAEEKEDLAEEGMIRGTGRAIMMPAKPLGRETIDRRPIFGFGRKMKRLAG